MKKQIAVMGIIGLAVINTSMLGAVAAEEAAEMAALQESLSEGADLYKNHGCATCHGADGDSPVKVTFPKLRGKDAAYLMKRMDYLVSDDESKKTVMHKEYYSDEALAQCAEPPTRAELELMAAWLATR